MPQIEPPRPILHVDHIKINHRTKLVYKKDPAYCTPDELLENIFEIPEPVTAEVIMSNGDRIPVVFHNTDVQVQFNKETVGPE